MAPLRRPATELATGCALLAAQMIDDAAEAASFISGYIVQGVMNERGNLGMQGSIGRRMFALPAASVCLKPRSGSSSLTHPVSACVCSGNN